MSSTPQVVLVTGAGQRLGRAIALDLARHGWAVGVHYNRSAGAAAAVVDAIVRAGGKAAALGADLRSEPETSRLVGAAVEALGPLGCLVNNASLFEYDSAETATPASWDAHLAVNLRAPFLLSQAFAAQLPEGAHGSIVNIIDQRVWNLTPHYLSYTVSKSGLWTLTRTLALALAPRIRVNGIGPGATLPAPHQTPEQFAHHAARMPLGHGTTPEEVTDAVRFLLAAPAITGQMLALDGGQHLGWAQPGPEDPALES
jgi:NAD(P)-dependent dehydrogenase (short-subunit alcohol dehydrogenase family)